MPIAYFKGVKSILCVIFIFLFNLTFSQRTKKIVVDDYELFAKHEYYVLRKDKTIKHGSYKSVWVNGNPRQEGYYHMGKKDSLWIYYNRMKPVVGSRGYYKEGKKIGIWEYYDDRGNILNRYDHTERFLSYSSYEDTTKVHAIRITDSLSLNDSIIETKLDFPPVYLEGEKNKFRIIQDNIVYPSTAIKDNIFGTVRIAFFVTKEGYAVDHKIIKSIGGGCYEEALRVVKLIPDEWCPGVLDGNIVEARVIVPITFVLN